MIEREKLAWKLAEAWYMTNPDTGFDGDSVWFYSLPHTRKADLFLKACQALSVIEPILTAAEGMREALGVIKPIELRQGDIAQYHNPQAKQMLNSNVMWGVTPSCKSAHKIKKLMDDLDKALAAFDAATAAEKQDG
jgi:hypothetical protein